MRHLLSIDDLQPEEVNSILRRARWRKETGRTDVNPIRVGLLFLEQSLRTRVGFETAAASLGATCSVIEGLRQSPVMGRPESAEDTVRSIASWFDTLVVRHPTAQGIRALAELSPTPIINAGNGNDEHPTQALVDLFAISETRGSLDNMRIGIVGDLDGMRTAHSLSLALSSVAGGYIRLIHPEGLPLPRRCEDRLVASGWSVGHSSNLSVSDLDVVYMAGLPAETSIGTIPPEIQSSLRLTREKADELSADATILSPFPRVDEIELAVDDLTQSRYFEQSELGIWVRAAILEFVSGFRGH